MRINFTQLFLLPIRTRVPLKFGNETLTEVTCARVCIEAVDRQDNRATGWGETPLSVQWVWPSAAPYQERLRRLIEFATVIATSLVGPGADGHALEIGKDFIEDQLPALLRAHNEGHSEQEPMPWLAALLCFSPFDLAAHDAFGKLVNRPVFETYAPPYLSRGLTELIEDEPALRRKFPSEFLTLPRRKELVAWHLVGGLDPLEHEDATIQPQDGYPVLLRDWIAIDGLQCLKIKLRGNDRRWDLDRLIRVGAIARESPVRWLSADFNCTVQDPAYVIEILDRIRRDHPAIDQMILYVEQPFPYDLEANRIDVHEIVSRKPLFLDESAHDWRHVRLGRELGWNGVALKTCKSLTGALLSACWAQLHDMSLMVQDLTNPMLAQISHVSLAAHLPTIMGVETNSMQFYPDVSAPEAAVHPGLFRRRGGAVDVSTVLGPGLGYRIEQMSRVLPPPFASFGSG